MGLIRVLLAVSVILAHAGPLFGLRLVGGHSVQAFFIISGFYMSMILGDQYSLDRAGIKRFYMSRYTRLMPTYWIVLLMAVGFAAWYGYTNFLDIRSYSNILHSIGWAPALWSIFSNVFLFGIDWTLFASILPTGAVRFASSFDAPGLPFHRLLLVPQAWSLGTELLFYMMAPFIVRRSNWFIGGMIVAGVGLRLAIYNSGFEAEPWTDRFFPTELPLFLVGILGNRFYRSPYFSAVQGYSSVGFVGAMALLFSFQWIDVGDPEIQRWIFFTGFAVCVPFVFHLTRKNVWDRRIGEISYPVYILQTLILQVVTSLLSSQRQSPALAVILITLPLSALLYWLVDRNVDRFRQRKFKVQANVGGIAAFPAGKASRRSANLPHSP